MRDFESKIDNDPTSAGVVVADEYNSSFTESKNAVKPFLVLDPQDDKQLSKSIDIATKSLFYGDIGTVNAVHLTRDTTSDQIETLASGIAVIFKVANNNTGASTLKLNALNTKPLVYNAAPLTAGMLKAGRYYIAIYSAGSFNIVFLDILNGSITYEMMGLLSVGLNNMRPNSVSTNQIVEHAVGLGELFQGFSNKIIGFNNLNNAVLIGAPLGVEQTWYDESLNRAINVEYTNSYGRPIEIVVSNDDFIGNDVINGIDSEVEISRSYIIPENGTYKITTPFERWLEMR